MELTDAALQLLDLTVSCRDLIQGLACHLCVLQYLEGRQELVKMLQRCYSNKSKASIELLELPSNL